MVLGVTALENVETCCDVFVPCKVILTSCCVVLGVTALEHVGTCAAGRIPLVSRHQSFLVFAILQLLLLLKPVITSIAGCIDKLHNNSCLVPLFFSVLSSVLYFPRAVCLETVAGQD